MDNKKQKPIDKANALILRMGHSFAARFVNAMYDSKIATEEEKQYWADVKKHLGVSKATEEELKQIPFTHLGSMNYIVQAWRNDDGSVRVDQYQPRRNTVWSDEIDEEEATQQIRETIERMKIAIINFEDFLKSKRDNVYYWEFDDEFKHIYGKNN